MNSFTFFAILFALLLIIMIHPSDAHSSKHVRTLCKRKAVRHIHKLCPDMCLTGGEISNMYMNTEELLSELINVSEYCTMGYSDSQVKHMCCPDQ
uniref:Saposin B-type domain-containing protein n=1 Tax=Caenorhabditis tropicalis TaxID=1561998 RepID=A0A1I7TNQ4_9PELO